MTTEAIPTDAQLREIRAVERALADADAARAKLTPNGRPVYAADEHARREQAIEETLEAEISRVSEAADTAVRESAAALERLTDADPLDALTSVEIEAANQRATFVREDAERLPLADLTRRIQQALGGSDRSMLYLWARYGDARLQAEQSGGHVRPADVEALRRLSEALRTAGDRFVDTRAREQATRRHAEARAFRARVWETQRPRLVEREVAAQRATGRYSF